MQAGHVSLSGPLTKLHFVQLVRTPDFATKKAAGAAVFLLLCQGSNLNSSDPESDVLPITPQSIIEAANIINF